MGEQAQRAETFNDHVDALRRRLLYPAALFFIGGFTAYFFYPQIIRFIRGSLSQPLYYDTPAGNFNLIMKICVLCGLALAIPVLTYNFIRFVEPAFKKRIGRHSVAIISVLALVLALCGAAFAMYVIVPMSLHFFASFNIDGVKPLLSANEYLSFVLTAITSAMVMFQVPLVVLFIDFIHPIPPSKLLKFEKWVIVGSVTIALILPFTYDPITQFVVAIPIVLLYNLSILVVWISHRSRFKKQSKTGAHTKATHHNTTKHIVHTAPQHQPVMAEIVKPKVASQNLDMDISPSTSVPRPRKAFDVFT